MKRAKICSIIAFHLLDYRVDRKIDRNPKDGIQFESEPTLLRPFWPGQRSVLPRNGTYFWHDLLDAAGNINVVVTLTTLKKSTDNILLIARACIKTKPYSCCGQYTEQTCRSYWEIDSRDSSLPPIICDPLRLHSSATIGRRCLMLAVTY